MTAVTSANSHAPIPESNSPPTAPAADGAPYKPAKTQRHWDAAQIQTRRYYRSLLEHHQPYLDCEAENMMGITITPIDLHSGSVSDSGPAFLERVSLKEMEAYVKTNKTSKRPLLEPIPEDDMEHPNNLEKSSGDYTRLLEGSSMLIALQECTHTRYNDNYNLTRFNPDWEAHVK